MLKNQIPGWEGLSCYLLGYNRHEKYLQAVHGLGTMTGWPLRVGRGASGKAFKMLEPEYFEKGQAPWPTFDRSYFVEPLHAGFDPDAVLALPLMYPYLLKGPEVGDKYGRSFAVLTIAANCRDSPLLTFNPWRPIGGEGVGAQGAKNNIEHVYGVIHGALMEYMSEHYSS